jgi:type I restriction enzyme S subunit
VAAMSKLDDLIREYCPDGVEYLPLNKLFNTRNGYTPSKKHIEYWEGGTFPWFRMEDIREHGRILSDSIQHVTAQAIKGDPFPENSIIISTSATIGEHALIEKPFLVNQRFTVLMIREEFKEKFDKKFLFYYCFKLDDFCNSHLNISSFNSVDMTAFKNFLFAVPPLPVQREIVRILDQYSEKMQELKETLEKEKEDREKQYKYYRDMLLTFDENNSIAKKYCPDGVENKELGLISEIRSGWGFPKKEQGNKEGDFPFYKVADMNTSGNEVYMNVAANYVSAEKAKKLKCKPAPEGTIIFPKIGAAIGTNKKRVLTRPACYDNNVMGIIPNQEKIINKFLFYFFESIELINLADYSGAMPSIRKSRISKLIIPVPPLPAQREIVQILDRFDALCHDMTTGLPAEIEARQKQYAYYRDKLLDFKPIKSGAN